MCGRYNITDSPVVHALLDDLGINIGELPNRYNIAPTDAALTIYHNGKCFDAMDMRWWLTPSWSQGPSQKFAMFNARSETVATSRAFQKPFERQRGIIPATSFIEWQRNEDVGASSNKQPYKIEPVGGAFFFAAVWDFWDRGSVQDINFEHEDERGEADGIYSVSMLTIQSQAPFSTIHHRQPLILSHQQAKIWVDPAQDIAVLNALMTAKLTCKLAITKVNSNINNSKLKIAPQHLTDTVVLD